MALDKRDILKYMDREHLNCRLRGYTYVIDVLYIASKIGDTGVSCDKAIKQAIETVAKDYGVTVRAVDTSARLLFREAGIDQTVKNTLRGMYYGILRSTE